MTAHRPAWVAEAPDAYKEAITSIEADITQPPAIMEGRLPPVMTVLIAALLFREDHAYICQQKIDMS